MQRYGVLVVDDSSFMRKSISLIIEKDPQLFVAGIARDGSEAIEKVQRLKPDIVTMDVEMPEMDGITALGKIMETYPVPVVMLSSYTEEGAEVTIRALEMGAVDFFLKSELFEQEVEQEVLDEFLHRLKTIAESAKIPPREVKVPGDKGIKSTERKSATKGQLVDLLIIGTSTGGPAALQSILPYFPEDTRVPILVLQHMPPGFTKSLAERFDTFCKLHVKEAEDGDILEAGNIYIAPAGFQTLLAKKNDGNVAIRVEDSMDEKILYKPSVNITLDSAAPIYKERLLTVILTGMGDDGLNGCRSVRKYNGHIIVEAEESCVVYGMPRAVFEAGLADFQVPLSNIYQQIMLYI
ncbi:chemotaxis response regulator protein-glutamate methylesterase [Thermosyntropha sp.]|uniref:protein-glutamate methylesterase/protein-glutamine glutaminase n=1 Tax=Thermosyntropha sp. TaxID=2740820 RepID=UPI0025D64D7D|nr:chemotaxis response regulator protein-glutamate methylesterase [Thermosyntropha sp.]MBO8159879.1 chemotaxis response regulator protein-glutamate methylesterase [Thermosyntropha sp.]